MISSAPREADRPLAGLVGARTITPAGGELIVRLYRRQIRPPGRG
jgi:hypothetical protein